MRYFFVLGLFASIGISGCNGPNIAEAEKDVRQYLLALENLHSTLSTVTDGKSAAQANNQITEIGNRLRELKAKQTHLRRGTWEMLAEQYESSRRKLFQAIREETQRLTNRFYGVRIADQVSQLFDELSGIDKKNE